MLYVARRQCLLMNCAKWLYQISVSLYCIVFRYEKEANHVAEGASVPALGLSNKAVYADETKTSCKDEREKVQDNEQYSESYFTPQIWTGLCSHQA